MRNCFCEDLTEYKQINKCLPLPKGIKRRYTVALVEYDHTGKEKRSTITHYNYYRYKLNFCPECGKQLKRSKQ